MEILKLFTRNQIHLIIFLFATFILINVVGCDGWSVMGYSLDKSQDSTQVIIEEINE